VVVALRESGGGLEGESVTILITRRRAAAALRESGGRLEGEWWLL